MSTFTLHHVPKQSLPINLSLWRRFLLWLNEELKRLRDLPNTCPLAKNCDGRCDYPEAREHWHGIFPCHSETCFLRTSVFEGDRNAEDGRRVNRLKYGQVAPPPWVKRKW